MNKSQVCVRCNRDTDDIRSDQNLCKKCCDIIEFGYPSFEGFKIQGNREESSVKRMDISEGWTLPAYVFKRI